MQMSISSRIVDKKLQDNNNLYVGSDPEECIKNLLIAADGDVSKAERGIVYIDEIDKKACTSENMSITRDVSGQGVQQALLKIIEGTVVDVTAKGQRHHPEAATTRVDTSRILFIVGGAFCGIEDIIKHRKKISSRNNIGFASTAKNDADKKASEYNALIEDVKTEDFKKFGLIPELLGRLPVIAPFQELSEEQLCQILVEPRNALTKQYQLMFKADDVDLIFEKPALKAIAQKAIKNGTGARGLRAIMEKILLDKMYSIPSTKDVKSLTITKSNIEKILNERKTNDESNRDVQRVS